MGIDLNFDERSQDKIVGRPWTAAIVEETETGEQHIYPADNGHEASPLCFCEPLIDQANVNIWIHKKVKR